MIRDLAVTSVFAASMFAGTEAWAQAVTVQQPVLRVFGANTTVIVPDRGSTLIGSVSRAGDSRSSFGVGPFLRFGSSVGSFREHSSMRAHVWIHDLDEMDRQVLEAAEQAERFTDIVPLTGNARHAFSALVAKHDRGIAVRVEQRKPLASPDRCTGSHPLAALDVVQATSHPSAAWYFQKGVEAEKRGAVGLAQVHFRAAAKHGSQAATEKLRIVSKPVAEVARLQNSG